MTYKEARDLAHVLALFDFDISETWIEVEEGFWSTQSDDCTLYYHAPAQRWYLFPLDLALTETPAIGPFTSMTSAKVFWCGEHDYSNAVLPSFYKPTGKR